MAELYGAAHARVERGWTQGELYDGVRVCLVGAIKLSTLNDQEQDDMQVDIASALIKQSPYARHYAQLSARQLRRHPNIGGHAINRDGGIAFVERWNDSRIRRKKRVLRLLAERRDHYAELAKEERMVFLEAENVRLSQRLDELVAEVERLEIQVSLFKVEVGFWKGRALERKRQEFANALSATAEVVEQREQNTMEMWEMRKPL